VTRPTFSNTRAAALAALGQAVAVKAQQLRTEIVEQLSQPGTGEIYDRHIASAPGDPPAVDSGRLRQSIVALKVDQFRWRVGTNVEYALYLEFGTRRMAPRPFLRPAAEKVRNG